MVEYFPRNDDKEYQEISENFKKIVKEQCNIGARKMFMITDAIQCQPCYHYETPGHAYCTCGKASPGASDEVQEKFFKNVFVSKNSRRAHENNHKARDHLKNARKKQPSTLDGYPNDERYRVHLQSEGITGETLKEWDRIANGPKREHVPA